MATMMGLMYLSESALNADQEAINITSNNVANQNTPGYTREVANFQDGDTVSLNGYQTGDETVSVSAQSQRDSVLEQMLQQQTSSSGQTSSRLAALQSVENLFGISSTSSNASSTTIGSALSGFFSSLTSLSANPTDSATREDVVSAAQTLVSAFNSTAQGLNSETTELNSQITTAASQINGLTSSIAQLNEQISQYSPNQDAGTLEDQRQEDIDQLSAIIGVNQLTSNGNGVMLTTSTGAVLVSGTTSYNVSTTPVDGNTQLVAGDPPTVQADVTGGSIGGMMQARDQDIPTMMSSLDQLAYSLGTAVNTQNEAGDTPSGTAGTAFFSLPSSASGSAGAISLSLSSADDIATAATTEGSSGTTNALALENIGTSAVVGGQTATNYFADFIGQVGDTVSSATTANTTATTSLTQAQTARDSLSAVSLDEEAQNLTQYQRSYEAAAKVFSIVNELLADTINLGTETTVS